MSGTSEGEDVPPPRKAERLAGSIPAPLPEFQRASSLESFESPPARFRRVDTYVDSVPPVLQIHPLSAHEKAKLALERSRLEAADWNPITPEIKIRRLELELKKEEKELEHSWKCCLCRKPTDSRMIRYIVQMFIIIGIMAMCIVKLATVTECTQQNLFLGILTLLLGVIMPQPSITRK